MGRFSTRLAARVVLMVVLVLVPALAIIVYDQANDRRRAREDAIENASRLAHLAVGEESRRLTDVQHLLATLAMFPGLRGDTSAACQPFLQKVIRDRPEYINLFVATARGATLCTAANLTVPAPLTVPRPASAPTWFTRVMQTRSTSIGDYQISLTNGRPSVIVAHPMFDDAGHVERIVAAVVGLDALNAVFTAVRLPHGATLTLTDRRGTILARTPDAAAWIGRRHAQFPAGKRADADPTHEMLESTGSDGVQRLYTVLPVNTGLDAGLFVTLDIETAAISREADHLLVGHLWLLGLVALGALAVALIGGHLLVLQPVEAQRREAEERMRFALEVSKVGVWHTKIVPGGQKVFWSETTEVMHGLERGSFDGSFENFMACVHADDREPVVTSITQAQAERRDVEVSYRTVWPDGTERRLATTGHYTFTASGDFVSGTGVTVDVTEQRSLEEQLRQAQKMDAVGRLAGGIAHDFNNMLTAILGNAQFLSDEFPEGDPRRKDIDEITKAAHRAAALTHQLLAFSRKQMLAPKVLRLGDVIAQTTPMLRRLLGETIDLRTTMGDHSNVKADAGQIGQVVINLAVNARDAMNTGGRLTIETADVTLDAAAVKQHPSMTPGAYVTITVSDTGHGMDAPTQKRIFEPFFSTKPVGQGTGLGLATVYGIVKQSGGHIWVHSEPGRGATFTVFLPRTDETIVSDAADVRNTAPRGTETVLVVEDERLVREFAAKVLTRQGYRVHTVASPARAIEFAAADTTGIDLILTDVVLPDMSGPAMAGELKRRRIDTAVMYMSGYTDDAVIGHDAIDGRSFLPKPFTSDQLAHAVREALDEVRA